MNNLNQEITMIAAVEKENVWAWNKPTGIFQGSKTF